LVILVFRAAFTRCKEIVPMHNSPAYEAAGNALVCCLQSDCLHAADPDLIRQISVKRFIDFHDRSTVRA
jgi:hypothetical protein